MSKYLSVKNARTPSFRVDSSYRLGDEDFLFLKDIAKNSGHHVARFLLHENDFSEMHVMIIYKNKEYEERWLRQLKSSIKVYEILEGECSLVFKDVQGDMIYLKKGDRYSFRPDKWHKFYISSDYLIYREEIPGPLENSRGEYIMIPDSDSF